MGHPDRKLIRKHKVAQGSIDALDQFDLINTYRAFHPKTIDFTTFPSIHGTFSRTDHKLSHKTSLIKFKKI